MSEKQIMLETLFHKNQLITRLEEWLISRDFYPLLKEAAASKEVEEKFFKKALVQLIIHKRMTIPTFVGIFLKEYTNPEEILEKLFKLKDLNFFTWDSFEKRFIVSFDIPASIQKEIDRYQFPLPMLIEPEEVTKNDETGYLTVSGSIILRDNFHTEDVNLPHINRMNKIPLKLDREIMSMISNSWRNLDRKKEDESEEEFQARKQAFEKYNKHCFEVTDLLEKNCDHFYLTHKYDKRGRTYCQGYHVNYQGNPWNKASIIFAEEEICSNSLDSSTS